MLSQFIPGIKTLVDRFFADTRLVTTISYSLYKGRGVTPQTFSISAISHFRGVGDLGLGDGIIAQQGIRKWILRAADLPTGVTVATLTLNDRITEGGVEYAVTGINKSLADYVEITTEGGN